MIEKIDIKNIATFDSSGVIITGLKKVNFVYGVNGSGKTTITKFIDDPTNEHFKDCSLSWKNGIEIKKLVYNKDFRTKNFGKGNIAGVFTLGQATKEEAEKIEEKRLILNELKEKGIKKKETIETQEKKLEILEDEFREKVWTSIYKKYEITFKEAFKGVMQKKSFLIKLLEEKKNNTSELKTYDDLLEKSKTIFGETPEKIDLINEIDFTDLLSIENEPIWKKKIIGKSDVDIARLIQKLNINDWVNEGRKFIQEGVKICPFCQQETINEKFLKQLEDYFDETFVADINIVKTNFDNYIRLLENIINELQTIIEKEKLNKNTKLNIDKFESRLKTISSLFLNNKEKINNKVKEPSREFILSNTEEQLNEINSIINEANNAIVKHNQIVDNFYIERIKLISNIWRFLTEENKVFISSFINDYKGLKQGIANLSKERDKLREDYLKLDKEIKLLSRNLTSVQPSVDEINKILKSFGFVNFEIVPSKQGLNQYEIQRENGELAEPTLSEGEITFITFLYFLQLSKGSTDETSITDDRVLIIDDPISSLDSNVLFVVSTLIKQIVKSIKSETGNIKQLILFTHNVYFHKEVSFIDGRTRECSNTNYWILRRINNASSIQDYGLNNPIHNSYELLWKELKNKEIRSGVSTQNTMRRIIETYFKILGKFGDDTLIEMFTNPQEKEVCRSLICWINEGSHSVPDDLYVELQDEIIEIYFGVFKSIFDKTGHIEHYNMMMN